MITKEALFFRHIVIPMPTHAITLDTLRRYAVARSLFAPTTLPLAIKRLGFVQADPIRAPARAQDLTLRHRVKGYKAGDLERRYAELDLEEDFFVNYGFVQRGVQALMHPRKPRIAWTQERAQQANDVLAFVREQGVVHPREVDAQFAHGKAKSGFGGASNASTQLLDGMHYRGMLRVAGRASGIRTYALPRQILPAFDESLGALNPDQAMDALVDVIVQKYAPLPERSLRELISHLRGGAPQWVGLRAATMERAKQRLASHVVGGVTWYWPADENPAAKRYDSLESVRLLAPFDPVVWDRRRFELLWGWAYRFEAYTPAAKRVRGYYALPLLWRDQVIGWGNVAVVDSKLSADLGYVAGSAPRDKVFKQALAEELERMSVFLS
jgi:uncharacterized protein